MRLEVSVKVVLLVCLVLTNAAGKIINSFVSLLAEPGLQVSVLVRVSGRFLTSAALLNFLPQAEQEKLSSPVWWVRWTVSSDLYLNCLSQCSQLSVLV